MRARPIKVVRQRHDMDCGIAALCMLTGKKYGDIAYLVKTMVPVFPKRGLSTEHLRQIAAETGLELKRVYKRDGSHLFDYRVGILGIIGGKVSWAGHWVVWKEGVIIDPDDEREVWGVEEYLRYTKSRIGGMLVPID